MLLNFPGGAACRPAAARLRSGPTTATSLLGKLQGVLRSLHLEGILVLVDRVDEPYLINGSTD